jgi:CDP-glycerol glycerophosphotransferase
MARVTAVVPIYEVAPYLDACLASLQAQTFGDIEVVVVDDGSTDGSRAIAERYAERDGRFRVISQPNRGLGNARNTGVAAATGEFLSFVDGDDALPREAYARLLASLDRTGSDFACGHVHRFTSTRTWPAPFLAKAFWRNRPTTHVTRFRWLLADRMAQNKLWRRSFWERHVLRFREGCLHEDIPVVVPAHFMAACVDVLSAPVYLYRERESGTQSITQRRTELRSLRDRVTAVEDARAQIARLAGPAAVRWYDESVVEQDLLYHLDVFDQGDAEYRRAFLDAAIAFLDRAGPGIEDRLPAIQRLKWHLVRRRLEPELLEVLRFQRAQLRSNPKRVIAGRVYGDYPFLGDPAVGVPRRIYRLDTTRRRLAHAITLLKPSRVPARDRPARAGAGLVVDSPPDTP